MTLEEKTAIDACKDQAAKERVSGTWGEYQNMSAYWTNRVQQNIIIDRAMQLYGEKCRIEAIPTVGTELVAKERQEQIKKHGRDIQSDRECNHDGQLISGANMLLDDMDDMRPLYEDQLIPQGWNRNVWSKMLNKPYKERLIIAAALIIAEYDRINE